jgi:hypothetical protein
MIQNLRELEIRNYMWLSIGRSFEKAIANTVASWGSLLMFVVAHYANKNLSTALIFSTLELMVFIKTMIFFFGHGIGFYFELLVIL